MEIDNINGSGKKYELRSNNNGSFDITDRTGSATRYSIDANGNHSFTGTSMNFNNVDIFKPLICGEIRPQAGTYFFSRKNWIYFCKNN